MQGVKGSMFCQGAEHGSARKERGIVLGHRGTGHASGNEKGLQVHVWILDHSLTESGKGIIP